MLLGSLDVDWMSLDVTKYMNSALDVLKAAVDVAFLNEATIAAGRMWSESVPPPRAPPTKQSKKPAM